MGPRAQRRVQNKRQCFYSVVHMNTDRNAALVSAHLHAVRVRLEGALALAAHEDAKLDGNVIPPETARGRGAAWIRL